MTYIDWIILILFLAYTIWDGVRRTKETSDISGFFLAGRTMPWWAMGLSVMATQASAITFIGTTGQAYVEDMRFVQTYLGLPFAMVILCLTIVPYYYKRNTFTAYQILEERFGLSTRLTTSLLFLISRGLALGTVIAAPSYVLSLLFEWELWSTILIIGTIATLYTMVGGITGVIMTDVKQMAIMFFGILFSFFWIWHKLSDDIGGMGEALTLAGALGKTQSFDLTFDISEKYNVWSGVIAGLFLMLSYFGTDQTQVQRYLTAKSLKDARGSLLLSAFAKVPMQFVILLLGVMLYVFYIFHQPPVTFREAVTDQTEQQMEFNRQHEERRTLALDFLSSTEDDQSRQKFIAADTEVNAVRANEIERQRIESAGNINDTNYIFPFFILNEIPIGVTGLLIAAIFAAALSSIDSELNALSTVSVVDWYKRLRKKEMSRSHYLFVSRSATVFWGILATGSAIALGETDSIIELVNQIGSYFYGSILGVFILLYFVKKSRGIGALLGLAAGMTTVFALDCLYIGSGGTFEFYLPSVFAPQQDITDGFSKAIEYLWLNPVGAGVVVFTGWIHGLIKG
jgi:Na+/proline symporter